MYGSLDVYHWRKVVVSRILGHNQQLVVPGVLDPVNMENDIFDGN
jgi:hypothetical protein